MTKKLQKTKSATMRSQTTNDENLLTEIRSLIEETRRSVAQTVNSALMLMNWHIGKRINGEVLKNKRAEYGKEIVASVSQQLTADYGKGFTRANLFRMMQFAEIFPDLEIVASLTATIDVDAYRRNFTD